MTNSATTQQLENKTTIDVTVKLSTLWIIVMFSMIYADILGFVTPGAVQELMTGVSGNVEITQELLFVAALLLEVPILMIYLSRVLKYKVNRWTNIFAGILTILYVIAGIETQPFFIFFVAIEVILMLIIIRTAWKWQKSEV